MSIGKDALKALLNYHDDLYYNQDSPILADAEYDELKKQYVSLYGEYDYVPGEANIDSIKFQHPTNISSLDKVQVTEIDKLISHVERLWPIVIQPKMDGLTLMSYPIENGSMTPSNFEHVTRGNGKIGEIVTEKVYAGVEGIGDTGVAIRLPIRSEVVMLKKYFDPINEKRIAEGKDPFKNLRNAAAGMLRNKDITKIEGLRAFAYNIILDDKHNCTAEQQIEIIKSWGWNTVDIFIPETIEEAIDYITTYDKKYRDNLEYEIDGLVIKHNGNKDFGETAHHPNNAIAVKFEAEGEWTKLKSVTWQVGKTGIIAPVAEIEPVEILGSTISRVTLHNIGIINALKVRINGQVKVIKANDVIPRVIEAKGGILRNDFPVVPPKVCPVCEAPTEFKEYILFCTGNDCEAQLEGKIALLASRDALNIEGLSEATIKKMIEYIKENQLELIKPLDFTLPFYFTYEEILKLPGFAPKSALKLFNNIQKAKDTELKRFIYAANIPLIGKSASEAMANELMNIDTLVSEINEFKRTSEIADFGPKMIDSLKKYAQNHFSMLWEAGVRPKAIEREIKKVENQLTIVITGSFEIPRKEIETIIKDAGHKVSGSISKKTSYLLANAGEESTSKYIKAKDLEIPIINTLDELKELL